MRTGCGIATFTEIENLNTFPPLSTDNMASGRISEVFVLHFTQQIQTGQGQARAHLTTGLCLAGIVNFKLLTC